MHVLSQRLKFKMFQQMPFCTFVPSTDLILKIVPIKARQHLFKVFIYLFFFNKELIVLEAFLNFQRKKENFPYNHEKNNC